MNLNAIKSKTLGDLLQHPWIQKFGRIIVFFLLIQILLFKLSGAVRSTWFSVEQAILPHSETTTVIRNIIIGELQEMNQLTTTQMSTKATVDIKDERNFLGGVPLGDTHVVYEAVGTVQAGIDIDQLDIQKIDVENHQIQLILPPPRIVEAFLDIDGSHVVVHFRRWFGRSVESDLQEEAQKEALALIEKEVCANNILEEANQHAKKLVKNILHEAGYEEVIVTTQPPGLNACHRV